MAPKGFYPLLVAQALLLISTALAGAFAVIYMVKGGDSPVSVSAIYILSFIVPSALCLAGARMPVWNSRRWMIPSLSLFAVYFLAVLLLRGWPRILVAGLASGVSLYMFWVPYNILIVRLTKRRNRGELMGTVFLLFPLVTAIFPLVGSALIVFSGYELLFVVASLVLFAGSLYLALGRQVAHGMVELTPRYREVGKDVLSGFFLQGTHEGIVLIVIPLLSYELAKNEVAVGGLFSLFALLAGVGVLLAGKASDRLGKRRLFVVAGAFASVPLLVLAGTSFDVTRFGIFQSLAAFTLPLAPVFLFVMSIDRAEGVLEGAIVAREALLNSGRILGGIVAILSILYANYHVALVSAALPLLAIGAIHVRPEPE